MNPKTAGVLRHYALTVPGVKDRVVQQATKLVLEPIFEADFRECSFGFRPRRSAHKALERIRVAVNAGSRWVVDADVRSSLTRSITRSCCGWCDVASVIVRC